jgi:vacuolar-type H+-ATPase subunit E/Vma4
VAFISQEAREKARELQVKADEEFAIEKACRIRASASPDSLRAWRIDGQR